MMTSMRALSFRVLGLALLLAFVGTSGDALAKSKKKPKVLRHYAELTAVTVAEDVIADLGLVTEVVEQRAREALAAHPQLVVSREGAPDPATDAKGFAKWLKKQKLATAFKVNIEIIDASEEVEPDPRTPGGQRLTVKLGIRMFGERMPVRGMAFTGEGSATIKQQIGKKIRDADRRYTWDSAAQQAMAQAITVSLSKITVAK